MFEVITDNEHVQTAVRATTTVWAWVKVRLWPLYSTGIIVSTLCLIASAQEKQLLADHLYGANPVLRNNRDDSVRDAKNKFEEDTTVAVKKHVFGMTRSEFDAEYSARHGSSASLTSKKKYSSF